MIVLATLATTALSLAQPWPLQILVDHVLGQRPLDGWSGGLVSMLPGTATPSGLLVWVVVSGLVIFAANSALETAISLGWTRVGRRMVYALSQDLFARAQRRSLAAHTQHAVGDTLSRIAVDAWCVHAVVDTLCMAPGHALAHHDRDGGGDAPARRPADAAGPGRGAVHGGGGVGVPQADA